MTRSRPGSRPISRGREAVRDGAVRIYDAGRRAVSRGYGAIRSLRSPTVRDSLLIVIAYVTGVAGLAVSMLGDPTDPQAAYGSTGIGLMGVSFLCLLLASLSVIRATGGDVRDR